jgi:hypothetical protein
MIIPLKIRKILMMKLFTRVLLNDKQYYQWCYFWLFGKRFSYISPEGFNAKLQWLKWFHRDPELSVLADKYKVREFVRKKIGESHLIPCYGVYESVDQIKWEKLPEKFVIKATHGSGWNLICKNKSLLDIRKIVKKLDRWLHLNYYHQEKEWHYQWIKPRLICEKLLDDTSNNLLEIKVLCYHGVPEFVIVYPSGSKYRNIYTKSWEVLEGETSYPRGPEISKPENLFYIFDLAGKLSDGLIFVRVDFFIHNGLVYFGELTLTPSMGFYRFKPPELDWVFGEPLKVPLTVN